jgi:hypothetical protein
MSCTHVVPLRGAPTRKTRRLPAMDKSAANDIPHVKRTLQCV